jgi:hypothetical protein
MQTRTEPKGLTENMGGKAGGVRRGDGRSGRRKVQNTIGNGKDR